MLIIGRSITMEAFFLGSHMEKIGLTGILSVKSRAEALVRDKDFEMNVAKTFSLTQFETEVADYYGNMSAGKYVLRPQMLDESLADGADFNEFSIVDLKTE